MRGSVQRLNDSACMIANAIGKFLLSILADNQVISVAVWAAVGIRLFLATTLVGQQPLLWCVPPSTDDSSLQISIFGEHIEQYQANRR
jgi:hypothetical protein